MRIGEILIILASSLLLASCAVLSKNPALSASDIESLESYHKPDGSLEYGSHATSVDGPTKRKMLVYLPEGYYSSGKRYPVFYLLHGARGNERDWIVDGNIIYIVDSLRNAGLSGDYILVLPNVNQYSDDEDYGNSRQKAPIESFFEIDGAVETGFVHDVVGTVDSLYRTIPRKEARSIAGLSIGGLQALYISATHPDSFNYVGLFSPMCSSFKLKSPYNVFYKNLEAKMAEQFVQPPLRYDISIGKCDIFLWQVKNFSRKMDKKGYPHTLTLVKGGHEWYNWKKFCTNFIREIFKEESSH